MLFGKQEGRFFRGIGHGIASLFVSFLDSISMLADIISYVRLFAVGLASVEIARSFNNLALGLEPGVMTGIAAVLIILVGHSLNLVMAALSVRGARRSAEHA